MANPTKATRRQTTPDPEPVEPVEPETPATPEPPAPPDDEVIAVVDGEDRPELPDDIFRSAIRIELENRGLSQAQVARDLNIDKNNFSRFMCGQQSIGSEVLARIMKHVGLTVAEDAPWAP